MLDKQFFAFDRQKIFSKSFRNIDKQNVFLKQRLSWWPNQQACLKCLPNNVYPFVRAFRVIDDECKFSFWYIKVFAYYIHSVVYLCRSLLEKQIKLVLMTRAHYSKNK